MLYLIGSGSEEADMAQEIIKGVPSSCIINMVGRTSITESITLAAQMDVVVSGDTGLMHIARALGVPVVGHFLAPKLPRSGIKTLRRQPRRVFCMQMSGGWMRKTSVFKTVP